MLEIESSLMKLLNKKSDKKDKENENGRNYTESSNLMG